MVKYRKYQITKEGLKELEKELKERTTTIRKDLQDQLDEESGEGDISENAGYYRVQEEMGSNEKRIEEIQNILKNATVVKDAAQNGQSTAQIGNSVTLKVRDKEIVYHIAGSTEADPTKNKISVDSPLGKALVGKKIGESASVKTPMGTQKYEITAIE